MSSVYGRDRATHRRRQSNCSRLRSSSTLAARVVFLRRSSDVPLAFALLARDGLEFACLARERTGCLAISIVDRKFRSWLANALFLPFSMGCDDCISPHNARAVEAAKPRRRSRNRRTHIIALVFRGRQLSRPVACDSGMAGDTADEISKTTRYSESTSSVLLLGKRRPLAIRSLVFASSNYDLHEHRRCGRLALALAPVFRCASPLVVVDACSVGRADLYRSSTAYLSFQ